MSRINTNVASLIGQINLQRSQADLQISLTRLSTGIRINSGKDDPAGLIASESINSDINALQNAISNTQLANEVIATTDSALGQISSLLNDIRGLITEAANTGALSQDQIAANQLQVDSSLEAIDRIAAITSFQGRKLLDGSLGFLTTSISAASLGSVHIDQATIPSSGVLTVSIDLTTAATRASINGMSTSGVLASQAIVEISGSTGAEVFTFGTGTTAAQIINAVNLVADATGVDASSTGATVTFTSKEYGTANYVEIKAVSGTFTGSGTRTTGADAVGRVNGTAFSAKGNQISLNTSTLDLSADLTTAFTAGSTTTFNIVGGGALFQIGPDIVTNQQARIGIDSVNVAQLDATVRGSVRRLYELRSGQAADLDSDATTAFKIVDAIINRITSLRGRLGAFQRTTLDSNLASLRDTFINISQAQSNIKDADFANETAGLTRAQILVQSGTSVLKIANQNPQQVLALLPQ